jgi:hypothetical protein
MNRHSERNLMMASGTGAYPNHHFRRAIPGNIDTVRQRLCEVLEEFNYIVLSENPLQAKRPRQKSIWVAMVLDYDVQLTIALKSISEASTLATFDYTIEQLFTKGEKQALEREAEAIIALAMATSSGAFCPSCGAENAGAVRFCRTCGKPVARNELPSELEVLRLTANASASQIEMVLGLGLCLITLLITLPIILFTSSPKGIIFGWIVLALGELLGIFYLLLGLRRLRQSLTAGSPPPEIQAATPRAIPGQERAALPPPPASITEGTTELINSSAVGVPAQSVKDTGSME